MKRWLVDIKLAERLVVVKALVLRPTAGTAEDEIRRVTQDESFVL